MDSLSQLLRLESETPWGLDVPRDVGARLHPFDRTLRTPGHEATASFVRDEAIAIAQLSGAVVLRDDATAFLDGARSPVTAFERRLANAARVRRRIAAGAGARFDLESLEAIFKDLFIGTREPDALDAPMLRPDGEPPRDDEPGSCLGSGISKPREWVPALFDVMNARNGETPFLHPILKASLIHGVFQIAAPLSFGNATIARLLMLRQLLRDGYRIFERVPLLSAFLIAPDRVSRAVERGFRERSATPLLECGLETLERAMSLATRNERRSESEQNRI